MLFRSMRSLLLTERRKNGDYNMDGIYPKKYAPVTLVKKRRRIEKKDTENRINPIEYITDSGHTLVMPPKT